jgi:hypothetical protein
VVACDDNRNAVVPQLYSDLARLGWVLTLVNYVACEILFGPDPELGCAVGRGRPRYPRIPIVKAFLVSYIDIKGRQGVVDKLRNDPALRAACSWPAGVQIPHRSTISRVFGELAANPWVVHYMLVELANAVHELRPGFGKVLAIDSTGIPAYCNPNNETTRDQKAAWGNVHDPRSKEPDGMVWMYGWKVHALVDVPTQLPMAFAVSPANENDSPFLRELVTCSKQDYDWFDPDVVLADKGYDGRQNVQLIHGLNAAALIPRIERPNRSKSTVHTLKGEPVCLGRKAMEFIGTDSQAGLHGFRCPANGCHRRQEPFKGYSVCDDVVWESFDDDPYTLGGLISRASPHWNRLYRRRWAVERFFGWWFSNGWVENHTCRGRERARLHFALSIVMFVAMALARMIQYKPEVSLVGMLRVA